jgi:hypothetical protein
MRSHGPRRIWAQFGAPLEGLTFADFAVLGAFFRMGREPVAVDILSEIPGIVSMQHGSAGLRM